MLNCVCVCWQAHLVAAFEKSLANMTCRLQSLTMTAEQKVTTDTHTIVYSNISLRFNSTFSTKVNSSNLQSTKPSSHHVNVTFRLKRETAPLIAQSSSVDLMSSCQLLIPLELSIRDYRRMSLLKQPDFQLKPKPYRKFENAELWKHWSTCGGGKGEFEAATHAQFLRSAGRLSPHALFSAGNIW